MYNILLVEDDKNIREMLVEYFAKRDKEKFNITLAENGLKGLDKAYENSYDLLLLDVMLPEMDGFTLCKEIRRYSDVPIMFITARTSEADMLNGYALGCDDYIVKPIALPVFYEKVKALIKRSKGLVRHNLLTVGNVSLNPNNGVVVSDGEEVTLTAKEYAILKILLENKNSVVSREKIITAFAQTDDTASPDEAKKVTELKVTKLPDKLTYTSEDVIEPDIDLSKIADEDATEESLIKYFSQFNLELKLDLTGMEIEAVYSDGTTEKVDAKDCKAELADPFNYGEVIKALIESEKNMPDFTEDMTEDEFKKIVTELNSKLYGMIYREYTVNVSYQDAQTSYKINFKNIWPDVPELDDRYEVVSVKAPEKVNYTKADTDFFYEADMPYDGSPESKEYYDETYFYPEFKGLEVTVKDNITGKTYTKTFDGTEEDMVYISTVYVRPDDTKTNLEVYVMGDVNEWLNLPEDEEYSTEVTGTFKVNYYANGVPSKDISSTKDTATKDTVTKSATGGNGAVQTGNPMTAVSVALVMLVASGAMFVCYRRKIEK